MGGALVGFLRANDETLQRLRHSLHLVIAIRQTFTGQRICTQLFLTMEQWAREQNLHRLALMVMTHNTHAIALYKKMGFTLELAAIRQAGAILLQFYREAATLLAERHGLVYPAELERVMLAQ